jgi:lipoate-protein ligase B
MGKRGSDTDFPDDGMEQALKSGAEVTTSPRGGETTYHGPGQLILYPLVNLRELRLGPRKYVETLEDIMIDTAAKFGVKARVC